MYDPRIIRYLFVYSYRLTQNEYINIYNKLYQFDFGHVYFITFLENCAE